MTTLADIWPVFGLRVSAGPIELTPVTDAELPGLVDLVRSGIHPPERMPFTVPWTDTAPADLAGNFAAFHWQSRAEFCSVRWVLTLVVRHEGDVVGVQGVSTRDFLVTRTGETGSWLAAAHQGKGIGTRMRQAICALLFDHLGAREISSSAFTDNAASLAVSRKVGYRANGVERVQRRPGELAISQRLLLRPEDFVRGPDELHVEGAGAVRALIGLPD